MKSDEVRKRFLEFFEKRGHKIIPSASLVPENDPSVLFTTAGMQQFKPYYIGKRNAVEDFGLLNTVSVQKCVRTSDIEEVGDERHLTFFEMLGNFSFGGYWKGEAIKYAHDFVVKEMGLTIDYVTVFEGEEGVPADIESEDIWKSIDPNIEVKKFGRADNFWGPTGEEGPCGPTTEIYVDGIEIWNIVFNEFFQHKNKILEPLEIKGIDTGMGLERLVKVVQKVSTVFDTDLFDFEVSRTGLDTKAKRVISDHMRAAVFMVADGVAPSNTERGYILRRIIRRAMVNKADPVEVVASVIEKYKNVYDLGDKEKIFAVLKDEEEKFKKVLDGAEKHLQMFKNKELSSRDMFFLWASEGIHPEIVKELGYKVDEIGFWEEMKKHREISKAGMEQKFKGGLGGHSEMEVRYHTATHLLRQALEDVLGEPVMQKGSNITPERLRFDFGFGRKLTDEEKTAVEKMVNEKIKENLPVNKVVMNREEAEKTGATHVFGEKYGNEVSIYFIGNLLESAYSKEFCGGPHVANISELGHFKIIKEEAVAAGVRRIKAVLE